MSILPKLWRIEIQRKWMPERPDWFTIKGENPKIASKVSLLSKIHYAVIFNIVAQTLRDVADIERCFLCAKFQKLSFN